MWQAITAVAVPMLGIIASLFRREPSTRLSKKIAHHIELATSLKDLPAPFAHMSELIAAEVKELARQEKGHLGRVLNKASLTLAIILAVLSGAGVYLLWNWITATRESPFLWVSISVSIIVGIALLVVTGAGFSTIYNSADSSKETREAAESTSGTKDSGGDEQ